MTIFLLVFLLFSTISLLKSNEFFEAFKKLSVYLALFPLYAIITSVFNKSDSPQIYKILNFSALIISFGSLIIFSLQFFISQKMLFTSLTQKIFPLFFGYNFSSTITEYQSLLVNINGLDLLRANLFFPDPHTQGFFLGMILPISYFLYKQTKKIIYFASVFIISLALLLSFARGAYISFLAMLLIMVVYYLITTKPKIIINLRLLTIIIAFLIFSLFNVPFYNRFWQSFNFSEGSIKQRFNILKEAAGLINENPLWGIGLGNYALRQKSVLATKVPPANLHNTYLEILIETGLINLLVFIGILIISIAKSINNPTILMSLLFFSIYALFETILYSHQVIPILMIIMAIANFKIKKPLRLNPSH